LLKKIIMKGQKQSKTNLLEKKQQALIKVVQQLLDENAYLKDLAVGTLETIKQMPDYENAIEKLKTKVAEESSKAEEAKSLEATSN
jgi:cell shape-determining protein MreC